MLPTSIAVPGHCSMIYGQGSACSQSVFNLDHQHVLDASERCVIEQAIKNVKWQYYKCPINIANLLEMLPLGIQDKLSVLLITHEGQGVPYYDQISYSFHVVLQGNAEDGPIIIDPVNPGGAISNAEIWIQNFITPSSIQKALMNKHTINYLPQFRFFTSAVFKERKEYELYCDFSRFSLEHPNFAIKEKMVDESKSGIWINSVFLNMYETYQFFSGLHSFQEVADHHQGSQKPPYTRLLDDHIRILRSLAPLSGYKR